MTKAGEEIKKRLKSIRNAEQAIVHRVWEGTKSMPAKELAAFIIQNAAEGFARGLVQEARNERRS